MLRQEHRQDHETEDMRLSGDCQGRLGDGLAAEITEEDNGGRQWFSVAVNLKIGNSLLDIGY
jgi:hypothetical protein